MDPITTTAVTKATEKGIEVLETEAKAFLEAVIVDPARELGGLLKDQISAMRHSNLIKIVASAKAKLSAAGLSPSHVPLKIIHPMLESASLEEEPALQELWANLLANSAYQSSSVRVCFIAMAKELTPREAKFLEALYSAMSPLDGKRPLAANYQKPGFDLRQVWGVGVQAGLMRYDRLPPFTQAEHDEHEPEITADRHEFEEMMGILKRNGILEESLVPKPIRLQLAPSAYPQTGVPRIPEQIPIQSEKVYVVTEFGMSFLQACRVPQKTLEWSN